MELYKPDQTEGILQVARSGRISRAQMPTAYRNQQGCRDSHAHSDHQNKTTAEV